MNERSFIFTMARGIFGVPTIFVGEQMFFGNDRFELVRHCIEHGGADRR